MSLYHKHRPQDFPDVMGNAAAIQSFQTLLQKDPKDRPRSYLIDGPSGCGKTTVARIAALKYLGADDMSLREINTSDNRGIDTAREIIDQIRFASPSGKPLVFIIDECHKTTNDWQNAMLKPLEDTPSHVYFFLCTTDPGKLLKAIHTRCARITVEAQTPESLYRLVRRIAKAEGLTHIPKEIYEELAENAGGSPRQALMLLDGITALTDPEEMKKVVTLGSDEQAQTIDLCRALLNQKAGWSTVNKVLANLKDSDPESIRRAVMGYASAVLLKTDNHRAGLVLECFAEPTYNTGFPGLVLAAYQVMSGE